MNKSGHIGIDHDEVVALHGGTDKRCEGEPWGYRKIASELGCSTQNARRHCLAEARREKENSKHSISDKLKELENKQIMNMSEFELGEIFTFDENEYGTIIDYLNTNYQDNAKNVRISLIKAYMPTLRKNASDINFLEVYGKVRQIVNKDED
jgi:hypothetical protein